MLGVQWVMPNTIVSLLFAWRNWLGTYSSKVWNLVPECLMWLVWKERNARTFEDIESPIDTLKTLLARTLFEWSRIWGLMHCSFLTDFLISISLSLWFVCICFKGSEFTIVNTLFFSSIKLLLSIKKKKRRAGPAIRNPNTTIIQVRVLIYIGCSMYSKNNMSWLIKLSVLSNRHVGLCYFFLFLSFLYFLFFLSRVTVQILFTQPLNSPNFSLILLLSNPKPTITKCRQIPNSSYIKKKHKSKIHMQCHNATTNAPKSHQSFYSYTCNTSLE